MGIGLSWVMGIAELIRDIRSETAVLPCCVGGPLPVTLVSLPFARVGEGEGATKFSVSFKAESITLASAATTEGGIDKPAVLELAVGIVSAPRNAGGSGRMIGLNGKGEFPVSALSFLLIKGFRSYRSEFQRDFR